MSKKYRSKHARVVHDVMRDAYDAGAVDKRTMRQFDATCLTLVDRLSAAQIKKLRARGSEPSRARPPPQRRAQAGRRMGEREPQGTLGPILKLLALVTKGLDAIA
jgi:putative transcriptional regulator